jgi:G3E family GTPase
MHAIYPMKITRKGNFNFVVLIGALLDKSSQGERKPKRQRKKLHDLSDVSSVGITAPGPLDEYRFNMFMRDLLSEKAKDIFRCKGVLSIKGQGNQKFIFQGVHETICYGPADQPWAEEEAKINKLVFIGKGLDRKVGTGEWPILWTRNARSAFCFFCSQSRYSRFCLGTVC